MGETWPERVKIGPKGRGKHVHKRTQMSKMSKMELAQWVKVHGWAKWAKVKLAEWANSGPNGRKGGPNGRRGGPDGRDKEAEWAKTIQKLGAPNGRQQKK